MGWTMQVVARLGSLENMLCLMQYSEGGKDWAAAGHEALK